MTRPLGCPISIGRIAALPSKDRKPSVTLRWSGGATFSRQFQRVARAFRPLIPVFFVLPFTFFVPIVLNSQTTTSGGLNGVVTDPSDACLLYTSWQSLPYGGAKFACSPRLSEISPRARIWKRHCSWRRNGLKSRSTRSETLLLVPISPEISRF